MKRSVWSVSAGTLSAIFLVTCWAGEADAAGGSFGLCYERLSQLAALHKAQGGAVTVVVDEPSERKYVLKLRYGAQDREMSCTREGDLLVDGEQRK